MPISQLGKILIYFILGVAASAILSIYVLSLSIETILVAGLGGIGIGSIGSMIVTLLSEYVSDKLDRKRENEEWFRETISEGLLDEVSAVKRGELPGEPGQHRSIWEAEFSETTRRRDPDFKKLMDEYANLLAEINQLESSQFKLARSFISDLPEGSFKSSAYIAGDVLVPDGAMPVNETDSDSNAAPVIQTGPTGAPELVSEPVKFEDWLLDTWPAFEAAGSSDEFGSELQAQYDELSYSGSTFDYWEQYLDLLEWEGLFWHHYENENIPHYYEVLNDKRDTIDTLKSKAQTIEGVIETEIQK